MILVTGASTGIGEALTIALAQKGYSVLAGCRQFKDLTKFSEFNKVTTIKLDVTDEKDLEQLSEFLKGSKEPLEVLVNNAGVVGAGPLEFMPLENLKKVFDVNVWGLLRTTQVCLPFLRTSKGRVVNVSSIAGRTVTPLLGPYNASKFSVEVINDALRMELLDTGIKFILIEPGSIRTPIWDKSQASLAIDFDKFPPKAHELYSVVMQKFSKLAQISQKKSSPVSLVTDQIVAAIESRDPRHRYLVGRDAKLSRLLNVLPSKFVDRLTMKVIHSIRI